MADFALQDGPAERRARLSDGRSNDAIHRMVARALQDRQVRDAVLVDIGCGRGALGDALRPFVRRYVGVDLVRYEGFAADVEFHQANLDDPETLQHLSAGADVVTAVETIEHLENPRRLVRLMTRLARQGGWVLVTTPNQESLLSLTTLVARGRFSQFQDVHYPAHITALLAIDLRRIARECGLSDVAIEYSCDGRVMFTPWHYPRPLARAFPRACSDNVMMVGRWTG